LQNSLPACVMNQLLLETCGFSHQMLWTNTKYRTAGEMHRQQHQYSQ